MTVETPRLVRALGVAAGALGIAAIFAGSPFAPSRADVGVDALSRDAVNESDHVSAIELAAWIRERRPGLRVVDIRTALEFDAYHVPTAERISTDSLSRTRFRSDETIVLYSEGAAAAAKARTLLRALGYQKVLFLREGLYEWLDQVMNPTLAIGASARDSARFASVAEVSRYFGGQPQATQAGTAKTTSSSSLVLKVRRRGC